MNQRNESDELGRCQCWLDFVDSMTPEDEARIEEMAQEIADGKRDPGTQLDLPEPFGITERELDAWAEEERKQEAGGGDSPAASQ